MIDKFTNILAIETTDKSGSVALFSGVDLLLEHILPAVQRSAQTLSPAIEGLLKESQLRPNDIGKVAVVLGPGSFTGLRIGVVTAKLFAYAVGAEIVGLSTFEVIAFSGMLSGLSGLMSIGVDAQRGDVVVQDWSVDAISGSYCKLSETLLMPVGEWWQHSAECGQNFIFAGPALRRFGSKCPAIVNLAQENLFEPRAASTAKLAQKKQQVSNIWTIKPIYARPSAAEERLKEK
jgi:tRNA threonylcarbamoyladenosine biosynthesis protein TsaB